VPARNTIFLSLVLGWAEVLGAHDLVIGVNALDYSGYPDCRPGFVDEFERLANVATKAGVEGEGFKIHAPLLHLTKADIAREAIRLGLDAGRREAGGQPLGRKGRQEGQGGQASETAHSTFLRFRRSSHGRPGGAIGAESVSLPAVRAIFLSTP